MHIHKWNDGVKGCFAKTLKSITAKLVILNVCKHDKTFKVLTNT